MAPQVRPGPNSIFDECKAVLSRLGLYRTGVPDDHHMEDQYNKPHSATRAKEKGAGDELAMLAAGMSISPPETASPAELDEGMRIVDDPADSGSVLLALDKDQQQLQLQQQLSQGVSDRADGGLSTPPLSEPQLLLPCGPGPAFHSIGGESMHSTVSASSWDAPVAVHNRRSRRSGLTTSTLDSVPELPGLGDPIGPIKAPHSSPGPQGSKVPSVLMYVHATCEPADLAEIERAASLVRSPGADPPQSAAAVAALAALAASSPAGLPPPAGSASGLKRLHSESANNLFEPRSPVMTRSVGGCLTPTQTRASVSSAGGGMVSPAHMAMRRNTRPAFVPRLNLGHLPVAECESEYGQRSNSLPKLPDSLCRCLDLAEEERRELESWTLPPKWQPTSEGRHYVFKPVNTQEVQRYERLRAAVDPHLASEVDHMWKELIQARYACELMASRGVRVVKDVTREWSEMSSHLIQRIETHEANANSMQAYCQQQTGVINQLTYQLKVAQAQAQAAAAAAAAHAPMGAVGYLPQAALSPQPAAHMKMGYDFGQFPGYGGEHFDFGVMGAAGPVGAMRPSRRADRGGAHGGLG